MKLYFVYILRCADNSYYTGITSDIQERLSQHQSGYYPENYTHSRRPVKLVFQAEFNDVEQAIAFEKQVKGWSRKKKEALITGNWDALPSLSVCQNETHYKNKGFDSAQPDKCSPQSDKT